MTAELTDRVVAWFTDNARDLPWRRPGADPWGVMVSEFMLQQTPVSRVLPVYQAWVERWPTASALALDSAGEAVRMWGRLGYPRRALRLHQCAVIIDRDHAGAVPSDHTTLLGLPGVGEYTAAAIASFGYRQRHVVLDTNVRRVLARLVAGVEQPAASLTAAERARAESLLPEAAETAARWAAASMELGALVCTAGTPRCDLCPVADGCAWRAAGYPPGEGPVRPAQTYAGTDRQCRGRLLAMLREAQGPVPAGTLDQAWEDDEQRTRCLKSLLSDGLVVPIGKVSFSLPL
jgi:A/G-specific adenine glycosylase